MFDNVGGKIKAVAKVVTWVGISASVISGFILMLQEGTGVIGLFIMMIGSLVSWISSLMTYGFGQLVENSDILVAQSRRESVYQNQNISNNYTPKIKTGGVSGNAADTINTLNKWRQDGLITEEEYRQKIENIGDERMV